MVIPEDDMDIGRRVILPPLDIPLPYWETIEPSRGVPQTAVGTRRA
jgi:hypothetical protein